VHIGDQIILESVKWKHALHVSKKATGQSHREITASHSASSWKVKQFASYSPQHELHFKAGDVITFFHAEKEEYLTSQRENSAAYLSTAGLSSRI
jgi:hypothetical protein